MVGDVGFVDPSANDGPVETVGILLMDHLTYLVFFLNIERIFKAGFVPNLNGKISSFLFRMSIIL